MNEKAIGRSNSKASVKYSSRVFIFEVSFSVYGARQHCGDSGGAGAIMRTGINRMQPLVSHGGGTLYTYLVFGQSGQRF